MNNETIAKITALSHDGRGVAKDINGKTLFIDGALPEEKVSYIVRRKHRRYDDAQVVSILEHAGDRQEALCPHFLQCGGCALQHLSEEAQIRFKQETWLEQFKHFGHVEPEEVLPPLQGPQYHYRHKARLGVRYVIKKGKVVIGFRERFNHYVADLNSCHILPKLISSLIPKLSNLIAELSCYQEIPQIEVACGENEQALVFRHLKPFTIDDEQKLIDFAKNNNIQLYLQPKGIDSIWKLFPLGMEDRLRYTLSMYDLTFNFHPSDFIQVNPQMNQSMIQQAIALMAPKDTDRILDLYCGIGNFTLPMAQLSHHVVGVEGSDIAVARAYENARINKIANVEFYAYDLAQDIQNEPWANQIYDKVLLDPPRSGAEAVLSVIIKKKIKKIVYVSCNPATLARDCGILVKAGYRLKQAGIMDMFPQTMHVESIALLEKD